MAIEGTVNEPAVVTVQGKPAVVMADGRFTATTPVIAGTTTLTVGATDPTGNTATRQYEVDSTGAGRTFTHDANGNLTSDGTRTFGWDARNQLVEASVGSHRSEFTYDGLQRRVRAVEKENSIVQSDRKVIWCQTVICEERAPDGVTVSRRSLSQGEQVAGAARFFAVDHLGSITDVIDNTATALGHYGFDAWGRRILTSGTDVTTVGFTGHQWQSSTGLWQPWYRAYDPELARWISEDPTGLMDGPNRYGYVRNNPLRYLDPDGRVGIAAVGVLAVLGWTYICQSRAQNNAKELFPPSQDKSRHCYVSCYFNRCMLLQVPGPTMIGGVLWEVTGGWNSDSKDDIRADWDGVISSFKIWSSCKQQCASCNSCGRK